jgi:hypothetical protein
MSWKTSTSTDFVDLLNDLITFATASQATTATVSAGGSSYVVGDKLTVSGGTFGTAATFEVTGVSGGAVTTVELLAGGDYTATPGNPASTTGGTGTGCTLTVTYVVPWIVQRRTKKATTATVTAGGTGYSVNDTLTLVGGVAGDTAATYNVDTLSGSAVATVSLVSAGHYAVPPSTPVSTTVSPAGGSGCTLTPTFVDNDTDFNEAILKGIGGGSDSIYVGIRTFKDGSSAYNWEVAGMTGYSATSRFKDQPGISPGRYDDPISSERPGCYTPLNNSTLTYWMSIDPRHIAMVAKSGSTYPNLYLGWLDQFGTAAEYDYPFLVMGCQSEYATIFSSTKIAYSGLCDPIADNDDGYGPGYVRDPGGNWRQVVNSHIAFSNRSEKTDCVVWPAGTPAPPTGADAYYTNVYEGNDFIPANGDPGVQGIEIMQTPQTGGNLSVLMPATVLESVPDKVALGEMRGVFAVSAVSDTTNLVTEDTVTIGNRVYTVFQNCNRSNVWAHFALEQA